MTSKKHNYSKVNWDEMNNSGHFQVTSNKGKSAKGVIKKSSDGKLIALIENTNYSDSYANKKVKSTLNTIFKDFTEDVYIQQAIDCLPNYIYTDSSEANGLSPNDPHTITGNYRHYCVSGAYDCGGSTYQGPVSVVYKGSVIGVCVGIAVEYAKFKVN
ncbi:MAG: hypothetical protein AAFZ89_01855 [Bacteroidota bacterium]